MNCMISITHVVLCGQCYTTSMPHRRTHLGSFCSSHLRVTLRWSVHAKARQNACVRFLQVRETHLPCHFVESTKNMHISGFVVVLVHVVSYTKVTH